MKQDLYLLKYYRPLERNKEDSIWTNPSGLANHGISGLPSPDWFCIALLHQDHGFLPCGNQLGHQPRQASEITSKTEKGPAPNTLNNTTEMTVSTLARTELAFKSAKVFLRVINVPLCFSLLELHCSGGDKVGYDNAQPQMSINDLCLRDYRSLSWGITSSNQSILTANLEVHTHCCSKAQQVLLRSVFR